MILTLDGTDTSSRPSTASISSSVPGSNPSWSLRGFGTTIRPALSIVARIGIRLPSHYHGAEAYLAQPLPSSDAHFCICLTSPAALLMQSVYFLSAIELGPS
jgi:hypothetical protein